MNKKLRNLIQLTNINHEGKKGRQLQIKPITNFLDNVLCLGKMEKSDS